MIQNRRKYERFSFNEPVGYQKQEDFPVEGALAEDISQTGLRLSVNAFIPLNTVLELQIKLPGLAPYVPTKATVVWVKEIPFRDDGWEIGLELISNSSPSSTAIRRYLNLREADNF